MGHNGVLSARQKEQFIEEGYFLIPDFFTLEEVEGVRQEISAIMARYPDVSEELVQIEPAVKRGEVTPASVELGVRKLFRMAKHSPFFRKLAFHPKMVGIAAELVGPDVTLIQSMLLMKPPHFGGQKVWHQDNAYFRMVPSRVFGFWVACDDTDPSNGCMHVIPGSHRQGISEHGGVGDDYGLLNPPSLDKAAVCALPAGGALIFHGEIYHYTPDNRTDRRRRALQYHYGASLCRTENSPFGAIRKEIVVAGEGAEQM